MGDTGFSGGFETKHDGWDKESWSKHDDLI
jgi:hypothetical protein